MGARASFLYIDFEETPKQKPPTGFVAKTLFEHLGNRREM